MNLVQLEVELDAQEAEAVESRLFAWGALSVEWLDAEDGDLLEPEPGTQPIWPRVQMRALFIDYERAALAAAALGDAADSRLAIRLESIAHRDWVRAGLEGLKPLQFGTSLWVVPSWLESPPSPDALILRLDPGLAFGTGTHPTTAMCLRALENHPPVAQSILDCGTGSGILAIAAILFGADNALGTDIDPLALESARENAVANGITEEVLHLQSGDLPLPEKHFDLILANILAAPLIRLSSQFLSSLRPGGRILLSGLLESQMEEVMDAYRHALQIHLLDQEDGWILLEGIASGTPQRAIELE